MCQATVYSLKDGQREEVMREVTRLIPVTPISQGASRGFGIGKYFSPELPPNADVQSRKAADSCPEYLPVLLRHGNRCDRTKDVLNRLRGGSLSVTSAA